LVQGAPNVEFGIPFAAMGCVDLALKEWEEIELDKRIFALLHEENFAAAQAGLIQTIMEATRKFVDESDYSRDVQEATESKSILMLVRRSWYNFNCCFLDPCIWNLETSTAPVVVSRPV
jgi:hypothetical protein